MNLRGWGFLLVFFIPIFSGAEIDDLVTSPSPFQVSAEELAQLRRQMLPELLQQSSLSEFVLAVEQRKVSLKQWADRLNRKNLEVLCLGETHSNLYRKLIGEKILPELKYSTLSLEMTDDELENLYQQYTEQKPVKWLAATMDPIFSASLLKLSKSRHLAIEATKEQSLATMKERISAPGEKLMTRDGFIAKNFLDKYQKGSLNVILYGANHCTKFDIGLPLEVPMFRRIAHVVGEERAKNVLILPLSRRSHPMVSFFAAAGVKRETFVLEDFSKIPPKAFNYRYDLIKFQQNYDVVIFVKD